MAMTITKSNLNISIDGSYSLSLDAKDIDVYLKEMTKNKGCELTITNSSYDIPRVTHDFALLNKYLHDISPSTIIFNSIILDCNMGKRYVNVTDLIMEIAKIPTIKFKCCHILSGFYQYFVTSKLKTIKITFDDCHILPVYKNVIMDGLRWNYTIRDLIISESKPIFDRSTGKLNNDVAVDGTIKSYLYRNRSIHLCHMAALTIILIRKYRTDHLLSCLDKSLVLYMSKIIYNTRTHAEWLKFVIANEVKNISKDI